MKRTFLARRNALLSGATASWGVFALTFALALLVFRLLLPNVFWQVLTPIFNLSNAIAAETNERFSGFGDQGNLALEKEELQKVNAALALENQALAERLADIGRLAPLPENIVAGVVARPPQSPYDTLIVAAGTREGVAVGMQAHGAGGVPLGSVSSVLEQFSRVTLFSAPGVETGGWVGSESIPVTLRGTGGGTLAASAPRSAEIEEGDVVYASGPGKLPVGVVARVDSDPSSPLVTLRIMPAINLFSVTWVSLRDTGRALPSP